MKHVLLTPIRLLAGFLLLCCNHLSAQTPCIDSSLINPNGICPAVYDPVCGCNGQTYGNSCEALNAGVIQWSPGECPPGNTCESLVVNFATLLVNNSRTISLSDQSSMSGGQIQAWFWDFGDGASSAETNPIHTFSANGTYLVCLTVWGIDANGNTCSKTLCQSLTVQADCADQCLYGVDVTLDGIALHASLTPIQPDPPFFFYVLWSLDDGAATGEGPVFNQLITEPGIHKVCATYPTGDFTAETCTVCKAFEVTASCIDTAQIDSVACPLAYIPVCGCNGVTYNNSCEAYNWAGVTAWKPGVCGSPCNNLSIDFEGFNSGGSLTVWTFNDKTAFPGGQVTSWFWDFGNGITSNEQNPTINFVDPGEHIACLFVSGQFADGTQCGTNLCKTIFIPEKSCVDPTVIDLNTLCPAVYQPVCGCDGITYENECVAYYHHGITQWTEGICPNQCINPAWIDTLAPCLEIYDPVCGCDGQTYQNECFATTHGVTAWKKGVCCTPQECKAQFNVTKLPGISILITDLSVNAESWHLTFGDGLEYTGGFDSLYHTYAVPGAYQICLEISNFAGTCTNTYCAIVEVGGFFSVTNPKDAIRCRIQPNPARDMVGIQIEGAKLEQATLVDVFGKAVAIHSISGTEASISVEKLPSGIYFMQLLTDQGSVSRKIVVQHE